MHKLVLSLVLSLLFFHPTGGAKKSDREYEGLKSDVRAVRIEKSSLFEKSGKWEEEARRVDEIVKYDAQGNLTDRTSYARGRAYVKTVFSYDAEGSRREEITHLAKPGQKEPNETEHYRRVYKYDKDGNRGEELFYSADGKLLEKTAYFYDSNGNVKETESSGKRLAGVSRCSIRRGDRGEELETTCKYSKSADSLKKTYEYEFDSAGNWIKRVMSMLINISSGETRLIKEATYRKIVYGSEDESETKNAIAKLEDVQPETGPSPPKIIRKSGGVLQQEAIKRVTPSYPIAAASAGISGAVVVEIVIDEEGKVMSARAISGPPQLCDAAIEAARRWQFRPTTLSGEPVKVIGTITFNFRP
ncbi:MAG TPA: energy transducer TonB [Blastocatellia bacterium]|jgi:TonB family protein